MMITILTPTYNREKNLKKLYESLKAQTNKSFEWIVVDDGSTDNTKTLIQEFIHTQEENSDPGTFAGTFNITYVHQENGGKHTALNRGINLAKGELLFIVDSDDWLTTDAIDTVIRYHEKYLPLKDKEKLCGYSFLRAYSNGQVNTGEFPENEKIDTYRQQRINNNLLGDKAEVFFTKVLKEYPFEVFENERFMPEDAVWLKMSGPYNMVHINEVVYISDYLEGGLTKSGRKMKIYSPYGMMYRSSIYLNDDKVILKVKIKMMILYHIYSSFAKLNDRKNNAGKEKVLEKRAKCRIGRGALYYITFLPSLLIFLRWKRWWK